MNRISPEPLQATLPSSPPHCLQGCPLQTPDAAGSLSSSVHVGHVASGYSSLLGTRSSGRESPHLILPDHNACPTAWLYGDRRILLWLEAFKLLPTSRAPSSPSGTVSSVGGCIVIVVGPVVVVPDGVVDAMVLTPVVPVGSVVPVPVVPPPAPSPSGPSSRLRSNVLGLSSLASSAALPRRLPWPLASPPFAASLPLVASLPFAA